MWLSTHYRVFFQINKFFCAMFSVTFCSAFRSAATHQRTEAFVTATNCCWSKRLMTISLCVIINVNHTAWYATFVVHFFLSDIIFVIFGHLFCSSLSLTLPVVYLKISSIVLTATMKLFYNPLDSCVNTHENWHFDSPENVKYLWLLFVIGIIFVVNWAEN